MGALMTFRSFFADVQSGMKKFGSDISIIVNTILLFVVYIIGVGITALVAKIVRKHFLVLKPKGKTLWIDAKKEQTEESHYRQF
jgi:hypothetical protein